jgi:hypothetical protein
LFATAKIREISANFGQKSAKISENVNEMGQKLAENCTFGIAGNFKEFQRKWGKIGQKMQKNLFPQFPARFHGRSATLKLLTIRPIFWRQIREGWRARADCT